MILIAVGSNLPAPGYGTPRQTCIAAAERLAALPVLTVQALSEWFETAPVPPSGQPWYSNGALRVASALDPAALLEALQEVEARFGRQRSVPNAARTLDLDIVAIGSLVRTVPDPVLPHPRMHQRGFVLRPLLDVAPDWIHPVLQRSVRQLWASLPAAEREAFALPHLRDAAARPN